MLYKVNLDFVDGKFRLIMRDANEQTQTLWLTGEQARILQQKLTIALDPRPKSHKDLLDLERNGRRGVGE